MRDKKKDKIHTFIVIIKNIETVCITIFKGFTNKIIVFDFKGQFRYG